MTMPAWVTFGTAVLGMCIVVVLVHRRSPVSMAIETERASRPEELSDAKLVHTETLFRVSKPGTLERALGGTAAQAVEAQEGSASSGIAFC